MLSEIEIRDRILHLLNRNLSIDDFEDWLSSASWNMQTWASNTIQKLVASIELRLAELHQGHLLECEFQIELHEMLEEMNTGTRHIGISFVDNVLIVSHITPDMLETETKSSSGFMSIHPSISREPAGDSSPRIEAELPVESWTH